MNFVEKILSPTRIHYIPYGIILGTLFFLFSELAMRLTSEKGHLFMRLLLAYGGYAGLLIIYNAVKRGFSFTSEKLSEIVKFPAQDTKKWIEQKTRELFTLDSHVTRVVVLLISTVFSFTLIIKGSPFHSKFLFLFFLIGLQPMVMICGLGVYASFALLILLAQVVRYPLKIPFYMVKHPLIIRLFEFYSRTTITILIANIWIVMTVIASPYRPTDLSNLWLVIISGYPFLSTLWVLSQIHVLMQRAKNAQIEAINERIQVLWKKNQG